MSRIRVLLPLLIVVFGAARAEEGMWRPNQLPAMAGELKRVGVQIEPGRLSDLLGHPMNAVISLGGCTASFVSPEGLVITNHHCAAGAIQYNSTPERNLLKDGFVAHRRSDELPAGPGSRVSVTVEVSDVTSKVTGGLAPGLSGRQRYDAIEEKTKELVAACEKDPGHRCRVAAYHGGAEYELIKQLEIKDVRLVHAPAGSIGNYGGDVDNWMWPRHTGDYSFYRAYVGPDGKPADPSPSNVPYKPSHYLRLAGEGVKEGSTVMVVGYPGSTSRHKLASETQSAFEWLYPATTKTNRRLLEIIAKQTEGRPDAAIKYASTVQGLNNTMKNNEGMLAGYARSDVIARKKDLESSLRRWIESDIERRGKYLPAIEEMDGLLETQRGRRERAFYYQTQVRRGALFGAARTLVRLAAEKEKPDAGREPGYQDRDVARIKERLTRMERTFDSSVDQAAWRQTIMNYAVLPAGQRVPAFDAWLGLTGGPLDEARLDALLQKTYEGTRLGDTKTRLSWMDSPRAALEKSEDPFMRLAASLLASDLDLEAQEKDLDGRLEAARARYMEALSAYLKAQGRPLYPDANGTLRVTYGTVKGYQPKDGVSYTPFTGLAGILDKDTGADPFDAPPAELTAIKERRFGRYADPDLGTVPVNFLTTLDTTGGNSGSPTLNDRGELVGLIFDGNWESMTSNWEYQPDLKRAIHVDIRYVLWVMEEVHQARELLAELGLRAEAERPAGGR